MAREISDVKVVILTGAGISAESGISTFRDSNGLWEKHQISKICTDGCLDTNRSETIEFYDKRRADIEDKAPNKAHLEIVKLKNKYPEEIFLMTQNIDDLFEKAGCDKDDIVHLHGFLREIRCMKCNYKEDITYSKLDDAWDSCPMCKANLRPNVIFFGEQAPEYEKMTEPLLDCDLLIVIGTSGAVLDVESFPTRYNIKYSILNNLEESQVINEKRFTKIYYKRATEVIDDIVSDIEYFLENGKLKD